MMVEEIDYFDVQGVGKNKQEAVVNAIGKVSGCAQKKYPQEVILQIKPVEIEILSLTTEKMKAKIVRITKLKEKYFVTLTVKTKVSMIVLS